MKRIDGIILVTIAAFTLAACGSAQEKDVAADGSSEAAQDSGITADLSEDAGEYVFYGTLMDGDFVLLDALEGTTTTLNPDGTGYLDWGEGNQNPITEWRTENGLIIIKSEENSFAGSIKDGVLMVEIGSVNGNFVECYVREDADTSDMPQLTAKEWAEKITGEMSEPESD